MKWDNLLTEESYREYAIKKALGSHDGSTSLWADSFRKSMKYPESEYKRYESYIEEKLKNYPQTPKSDLKLFSEWLSELQKTLYG